MIGLVLYDRPAEGTSARGELNGLFDSWRRSKRAIGGYHLGSLAIRNLGMTQLTDYYNTILGMKIIETTFGIISYEGIIWQMDLIKNGVNYRRTLNPKYWHNRVGVNYTDPNGATGPTWSENTDSSAIYGTMEYMITLGKATAATASAVAAKELVRYAWPTSRNVGSVTLGEPSIMLLDGLYITTAGFSSTLNWRYYESNATQGASTLIGTLLGGVDFVTAGRIEANTTSTEIEAATIPQRIGDLIEDVIDFGDASGNIWKGGVYANQEYIYEQVPTTVDYVLQDGTLYRTGGVIEPAPLINPGFYVRDTNAPAGYQPPGTSNIWDDPQVSYCDEVEYIWPDKLVLRFPGEQPMTQVVILADQTNNNGAFDPRNTPWGWGAIPNPPLFTGRNQ